MKPTSNILTRVQVVKTRKDAELQEAVERVRSLINRDREGTKWKPLGYVAVLMKLKRAGYDSADKISLLLGSVKDAENPVRNLFYKLKV